VAASVTRGGYVELAIRKLFWSSREPGETLREEAMEGGPAGFAGGAQGARRAHDFRRELGTLQSLDSNVAGLGRRHLPAGSKALGGIRPRRADLLRKPDGCHCRLHPGDRVAG